MRSRGEGDIERRQDRCDRPTSGAIDERCDRPTSALIDRDRRSRRSSAQCDRWTNDVIWALSSLSLSLIWALSSLSLSLSLSLSRSYLK